MCAKQLGDTKSRFEFLRLRCIAFTPRFRDLVEFARQSFEFVVTLTASLGMRLPRPIRRPRAAPITIAVSDMAGARAR